MCDAFFPQPETPIADQVNNALSMLLTKSIETTFMWLPVHRNIAGNENADWGEGQNSESNTADN